MSGEAAVRLVEVTTRDLEGLPDARGNSTREMLASDHGIHVGRVRVILGYQVLGNLTEEEAERTVYDLFADPIIEKGRMGESLLSSFSEPPEIAIQVGFKPGVTDNSGQAGLDGLTTIFPHHGSAQVATTRTYAFWGVPEGTSPEAISKALHNSMIERAAIADPDQCAEGVWPSLEFPERPPMPYSPPAVIDLEVDDSELVSISEKGLLALNLEEMQAIQSHYRDPDVRSARQTLGLPPNAPTDACLLYTSPSPRDRTRSRMPSSA